MSTAPKVPNTPQQELEKARMARKFIREDIDNFCAEHGLTLSDFFRSSDLARVLETINLSIQTLEMIEETLKGRQTDV